MEKEKVVLKRLVYDSKEMITTNQKEQGVYQKQVMFKK